MHISGQERRKLRDALIDAFPNKSSLEQMLSFQLNKKLDQIACGDDLNTVVFNLIKESEAQNWIQELIYAARNSNSGNSSLRAIAGKLLSNHYPQANINIPNTNIYYDLHSRYAIETQPIKKKPLLHPNTDTLRNKVKKYTLNQEPIISIPQFTPAKGQEVSYLTPQQNLTQYDQSSSQLVEQKFPLPLWTVNFETIRVDATGKMVECYTNKKAKFFKEDLGNGITLEMVYIPGGSFYMGSPLREKGQNKDEQPQHTVNLSAFFIGKFQVTQQGV